MPVQPTVDLPVGQGRLLRFNEPVESVLIADTTIADLQVVSPGVVYVFGLKPGLTNLIAITSDERIKATAQFRVTADISSANQAKKAMRPNSATNLAIFGNRIVTTGEARGVDEATDMDNIARTFSPTEEPPINNMTVKGSQQVNIRCSPTVSIGTSATRAPASNSTCFKTTVYRAATPEISVSTWARIMASTSIS